MLENSMKDFQIRDYQKQPLNEEALKQLLQKTGVAAIELIRRQESLWKEHYRDKTLSEKELIQLMLEHPKLMERPILESETSAIIGRPVERCIEFLKA